MMSAMIPEDPDERRMFDGGAETFGGSLNYIAVMLTVWHKMAPEGGSYRAQLAIMANEVRRAADGKTEDRK